MSGLPQLPAGFELEAAPSPPPLPEGFQIESGPRISDAVTDIPAEIGRTAGKNIDAIREGVTNKGEQGVIGGQLATGRAMLAVPGLLASPITGALRSLIGHPMAQAEHAIGTAIAPEIAAKDNPQEMYNTAADNVETALAGARPAGVGPRGPLTTPAPAPAAAELKSAAVSGYDAAKSSGVEFKPSSMQNFTTKAQADLNADGLNEVLAPKTFGVLDKLGNPPPGATVTTNDFRTMQRALGHAAKSPDPTERLAASRAIESLNSHIENIPAADLLRGTPADAAGVSQTIKEANANYGAYKRATEFDLRGEKAMNNAAAANSGMNLENQLRTQVRQILNNPKLQRGYDAKTLEAFREFNRGTRTANLVRAIGNVLGGGGGVVGTGMSAGAGFMAGGPAGAAVAPLAGVAVKSLGNRMSVKSFDKLGELIRANSPLARSLQPQPVPQLGPVGNAGMGALMSGIAPRSLFPYLAGPVPTYADENKRRR